jgi:hypothetical protein
VEEWNAHYGSSNEARKPQNAGSQKEAADASAEVVSSQTQDVQQTEEPMASEPKVEDDDLDLSDGETFMQWYRSRKRSQDDD